MSKLRLFIHAVMFLAVAGIFLGVLSYFLAREITCAPAASLSAESFEQRLPALARILMFMALAETAGSAIALFMAWQARARLSNLEGDYREATEALELDGAAAGSVLAEPVGPNRLKAAVMRMQTELQEAKRQARAAATRLGLQERKVRAVIEKAVDVICIINVDAKFVSVSNASESAWGYAPAELEGRSLREFLVSDHLEAILKLILGASQSIEKIIFECGVRSKTAEVIQVVWTGHFSPTDGGLFCIVHDITERKRAEELVKTSEQRLKTTIERLPAGVLLLSDSQQVEFANSEAARLFKRNAAELLAQPCSKLFPEAIMREKLNAKTAVTVDTVARRSDSSEFPVEMALNSIELSSEEKQIIVFFDKTSQHELERMKSDFVSMVVHDLRNPLTTIGGMLDLFEEGALGQINEMGKEVAAGLRRDIRGLIRLTKDLLDLEKIKSGIFGLECSELCLRGVIERAAERMRSAAGEKNLNFDLALNDSICWGDEERLLQVLLNLLSNAVKYSFNESLICISMQEQEASVKISVIDTGRGVPADKIARIFEKFEQVDSLDAKKKSGIGLGLAICKAIVEEHGGEIGVDSEVGRGSTFWFTVPKPGGGVASAATPATTATVVE